MGQDKKKVLILDDQLEVAVPLQTVLEDHGFDANATIKVSEFDKNLAQASWDAVVIDVYLPTKSGNKPIGLDIARRISKDRPRLAIVLISGWLTSKTEIDQCVGEIGARLVWKPFGTGGEIIEAISSLIERKSSDQQV